MPDEFNPTIEMMEQMRELRRDVSEIRTNQAKQPTREDLQAYVLKEVFELEVKTLKQTDQNQQEHLDELQKSVQSQMVRWLQQGAVIVSLILGLIALFKLFLPH